MFSIVAALNVKGVIVAADGGQVLTIREMADPLCFSRKSAEAPDFRLGTCRGVYGKQCDKRRRVFSQKRAQTVHYLFG